MNLYESQQDHDRINQLLMEKIKNANLSLYSKIRLDPVFQKLWTYYSTQANGAELRRLLTLCLEHKQIDLDFYKLAQSVLKLKTAEWPDYESRIIQTLKNEIDDLVAKQKKNQWSFGAFSKLFGYIRYFHTSDEAAEIDWERFAIYGAASIKSACDQKELIVNLRKLFQPFAPTLEIFPSDQQPTSIVIPENSTTGEPARCHSRECFVKLSTSAGIHVKAAAVIIFNLLYQFDTRRLM